MTSGVSPTLELTDADAEQRPNGRLSLLAFADTALNTSARFWFLVTAIGQVLFALYIVMFYGSTALQGNLPAWNKVLPHGYVPGDAMGNSALAAHLLLAAMITLGGLLQLTPQIRSRMPSFHRWNGRIYMLTAVMAAVFGLYMVWFRAGDSAFLQHLGISLDAILIIVFAALALRHALVRDIKAHRRWALRLFMAVNSVWFFRVGLMFWVFINKGPAGFDPHTFKGPFLDFWSFADCLLPLAVLELYLRTRDRAEAFGRLLMAGSLMLLTVALGIGVFVAFMGMWWPHM